MPLTSALLLVLLLLVLVLLLLLLPPAAPPAAGKYQNCPTCRLSLVVVVVVLQKKTIARARKNKFEVLGSLFDFTRNQDSCSNQPS